jgi:hypothetical protein
VKDYKHKIIFKLLLKILNMSIYQYCNGINSVLSNRGIIIEDEYLITVSNDSFTINELMNGFIGHLKNLNILTIEEINEEVQMTKIMEFIDKLSFIDRTNYQVSITKVKHQVHITGGLKYLEIDKIFIEETHGNPFTFQFYKDTNYPQTSAECDEKGFWYNPKVYLGTSFIQMIDNGSESVCYNPGNIPFNMTKTKITVNGNVVDLYTVTCNGLNGDLDIKIETKKNDN